MAPGLFSEMDINLNFELSLQDFSYYGRQMENWLMGNFVIFCWLLTLYPVVRGHQSQDETWMDIEFSLDKMSKLCELVYECKTSQKCTGGHVTSPLNFFASNDDACSKHTINLVASFWVGILTVHVYWYCTYFTCFTDHF